MAERTWQKACNAECAKVLKHLHTAESELDQAGAVLNNMESVGSILELIERVRMNINNHIIPKVRDKLINL